MKCGVAQSSKKKGKPLENTTPVLRHTLGEVSVSYFTVLIGWILAVEAESGAWEEKRVHVTQFLGKACLPVSPPKKWTDPSLRRFFFLCFFLH